MLTRCLPWIRFLRLPAVLTVPGDVWVGAALAGREFSLSATLAVALAYLFGMALNDLVDAPRDRVERPERPLPAKEISLPAARLLCILLGLFAFVLQPGMPMLLLLLLVAGYDLLKDFHPLPGALLMAACRCAVLWIGAGAPSLSRSGELIPLFGIWGLLIAGITLLAGRENKPTPRLRDYSVALTLCWLGAPAAALILGRPGFTLFLPWALLTALALQNYRRIREQEEMLPRNTGQWLSMLIPLQSVFLFALAPPWQGWVILGCWFCLRWTLRRIRIS